MWILIILSLGSYVNTTTPVEFMSKDACLKAQQKVDEALAQSKLDVKTLCVWQGE